MAVSDSKVDQLKEEVEERKLIVFYVRCGLLCQLLGSIFLGLGTHSWLISSGCVLILFGLAGVSVSYHNLTIRALKR